MASDRSIGAVILVGSALGIVIYGLLLYFFTKAILELTAFLAVVVLLGILAWIGWTMATTPPPEPMPEVAPTSIGGAGTSSVQTPPTAKQ